MKKWHWNSVFGLEEMMEFFIFWFQFIVNRRRGGVAYSVDVFCGVASMEGMLESHSVGHFFVRSGLRGPVFPVQPPPHAG